MTTTIHDHNESVSAPVADTAGHTTPPFVTTPGVKEAVQDFLHQWVTAWNARDAHALADLHTADCVTINRYGTVIPDRNSAEAALSFLLGPQGPFGATVFEPMQLVTVREVATGVAILQASWQAPVLAPNGTIVPGEFNPMMLSYTLLNRNGQWKTTQIDGHNVDHMELPFSSPEQTR